MKQLNRRDFLRLSTLGFGSAVILIQLAAVQVLLPSVVLKPVPPSLMV